MPYDRSLDSGELDPQAFTGVAVITHKRRILIRLEPGVEQALASELALDQARAARSKTYKARSLTRLCEDLIKEALAAKGHAFTNAFSLRVLESAAFGASASDDDHASGGHAD